MSLKVHKSNPNLSLFVNKWHFCRSALIKWDKNIVALIDSPHELRIDNRRQSVIRATFHYSLVIKCRVLCHISNDSLYFCVSSHINHVMIDFIFQEL